MPLDFSYERKNDTNIYSRTPLGILTVFLCILRERFSPTLAGQNNGFVWSPPPPQIAKPEDYKNTSIYIEKWGSVYAKVENFTPAITVKRSAVQYQHMVFEDKTDHHLYTSAKLRLGQVATGMTISCYSRNEGEAEILGNLVYEFFVRCRWEIQRIFEINICQPRFLSETAVYKETQMLDNRVYKTDVMIDLNFDFNHAVVPLKPRLKEIEIFLKGDADGFGPTLQSALIN